MRSQKQGWGRDSPFHQDRDDLSQSPLKAGRVSQGSPPQPSSVLTAGPELELTLCHHRASAHQDRYRGSKRGAKVSHIRPSTTQSSPSLSLALVFPPVKWSLP